MSILENVELYSTGRRLENVANYLDKKKLEEKEIKEMNYVADLFAKIGKNSDYRKSINDSELCSLTDNVTPHFLRGFNELNIDYKINFDLFLNFLTSPRENNIDRTERKSLIKLLNFMAKSIYVSVES